MHICNRCYFFPHFIFLRLYVKPYQMQSTCKQKFILMRQVPQMFIFNSPDGLLRSSDKTVSVAFKTDCCCYNFRAVFFKAIFPFHTAIILFRCFFQFNSTLVPLTSTRRPLRIIAHRKNTWIYTSRLAITINYISVVYFTTLRDSQLRLHRVDGGGETQMVWKDAVVIWDGSPNRLQINN
jgi:hypothetical protein